MTQNRKPPHPGRPTHPPSPPTTRYPAGFLFPGHVGAARTSSPSQGPLGSGGDHAPRCPATARRHVHLGASLSLRRGWRPRQRPTSSACSQSLNAGGRSQGRGSAPTEDTRAQESGLAGLGPQGDSAGRPTAVSKRATPVPGLGAAFRRESRAAREGLSGPHLWGARGAPGVLPAREVPSLIGHTEHAPGVAGPLLDGEKRPHSPPLLFFLI